MRQSFKIFVVAGVAVSFFILISSTVQAQVLSTSTARSATTVSSMGQITVTVSLDNSREVITPSLISSVAPTVPARLKLVGSVFAIQTRDASAIRAMTVRVRYTPLSQMDERQLIVAYYDTTVDKWLPLPTTLDSVHHVATATTDQAGIYALVMSPAIASLPPSAIIVDDLAAGFARYGSAAGWHSVSGTADHYYLGHMYWTSNTLSALDNYAVWTPALSAGSYQVYAFIDWDNATTQNARYQIVHNGQTTVFLVNQNDHYAEWVSLGTYSFGSVSSSNYVRLDDVTNETSLSKRIGFDAMAFVPNKVYLPVVLKNYWTPPPQPVPKYWSGMHMGNRNNEAWTDDMLRSFDPAKGGAWPTIAVVLSHQLFTVNRDGNCHITSVSVKPTGQSLYDYLKQATLQKGAWVIVRIYPSPGNFQESIDPDWPNPQTRPPTRTLISQVGVHPSGWTQCDGYTQERFRAVDDIGDEILAIQRYVHDRGWDVFGFEPANEPNAEWFANPGGSTPSPPYYEPGSWQAMDQYFANLYDYVHANAGSLTIRVFTPPMAQSAYAEPLEINSPITLTTCIPRAVIDASGAEVGSGYDNMQATYTTKNDGFSWHNYWNQGREAWGNCPPTHHVYKVFPAWMKDQIRNSGKPSFITESDLSSPGQGMGNPLSSKDDPTTTADSIEQFIAAEVWGQNVVIWLINNNFADKPEYDWHEAFNDDDTPRSWFTEWWRRSGQ